LARLRFPWNSAGSGATRPRFGRARPVPTARPPLAGPAVPG